MNPLRNRLLLPLTFGAILASVAACSDEKGEADPVEIVPNRCAIYWARENPLDLSLDFFALDMPLDLWVTGNDDYGLTNQGWFAYRSVDGSLTAALGLSVATSGEFSLTVGGTGAGDAISFVDGTAQLLVDARTAIDPAGVGTGGAGTFVGVWSDPSANQSSDIDWGTGSLTVTYLGSSMTLGGSELGGMSSYAQCYDEAASAFAPGLPPGFKSSRSGTSNGKGSR